MAEFHLHSAALKALVGKAKGGLRKKDHPIHGVAWLRTTERGIVLYAGDLEYVVETVVDVADIKETGEVGLPVERLLGMSDALFDGTVHVKTEDGSCGFYLQRTRWKLPIVKPTSEVSRPPVLKSEVTVDQADLLTALESIKFMLSDTSPYPLIRIRHGKLEATNSKQAAIITLPSWPKDAKAELQLSNRGVTEVISLLRHVQTQKVTVAGDNLWTQMTSGQDCCWIRKIAVVLPELDPMFQVVDPKEVAVSAEQLLSALSRVRALSSGEAVATIQVSATQITIKVVDQRGSEAVDVVDCVWKGGETFEGSYDVSELEQAIQLAAVKGELKIVLTKDKLFVSGARSRGVLAASTGASSAKPPVVRKPRKTTEDIGASKSETVE